MSLVQPGGARRLTDNHHVEVEALAHTLSVPLVGKVGEANIAGQLSADNVPVVNNRRLGGNYWAGVRRLKFLRLLDRGIWLAIGRRGGSRRHRGFGAVRS